MSWRCIRGEFRDSYPATYDRTDCFGSPLEAGVLSFVSRLREEPDSDDGSSPDEGVPRKLLDIAVLENPCRWGLVTPRGRSATGSR